ncbi:MAG: hypothetical protein F6K49_36335 [Moorea sp. SIO3I6]|nr:hypothetical protein [Moorena sp. SIO3I6]NEP27211.1 hypothetical protein [Moorena sp. SIO3I6]
MTISVLKLIVITVVIKFVCTGARSQRNSDRYFSEPGLTQSPLNPPILGDFDIIPPQNWGVRGAKPTQLRKSYEPLDIAVEVKVKTYFCSLFPVPCSLHTKILCPKLYFPCYKIYLTGLGIQTPINLGNFLHPPSPLTVFHGHDGFIVPMKVVGQIGYLLMELIQGVA